jgi:Cu/Ag efflux protein CusF
LSQQPNVVIGTAWRGLLAAAMRAEPDAAADASSGLQESAASARTGKITDLSSVRPNQVTRPKQYLPPSRERAPGVFIHPEGTRPMHTFRRLFVVTIIASASGFTGIAQSQSSMQGHSHQAMVPAPAAKTAEMSEGEVRKVDLTAKKITLKHGPLKNLDMPPMTMAFEVRDPSMLANWKVGDKVKFVASNPAGKLTLEEIRAVQ